MQSLIVSQLGYRPEDSKRILLVDDECSQAPLLLIVDLAAGEPVLEAEFTPWGEKWGRYYWVCDIDQPLPAGSYFAQAGETHSLHFAVEDHVFTQRTLQLVAVEQLGRRIGDKMGWQDCGSDLRAVEGNAIQLLGLLHCQEALGVPLQEQIARGADYLVACQREDGSFVNEYYCESDRRSLTLCGLAVTALAEANAATDNFRYLCAAKQGWKYLLAHSGYTREERLAEIADSRRIFGQYAPWSPPDELRARDILLYIRAGAALYRCTNDVQFKADILPLARAICDDYQFLEHSRLGLWGNFLAWKTRGIFQRAWEHAGWGYNCGAILPDDIAGLIELLELFPEEPVCTGVRYALHQYAYGYLLRVVEHSPFQIYPLALLESGEIAFFGPAWHGFNGMYALLARNAMLLARLFDDRRLEAVAVNQLQFIVGQNPIQAEEYTGISFINGIGERQSRFWNDIPGAIANGISASPQFRLVHADDLVDAPAYHTSEDWIVHSGGWLSGISAVEAPRKLKIKTMCEGSPVVVSVTVNGVPYQTDKRGLLHLTPAAGTADIVLEWQQQVVRVSKPLIGGKCCECIVDFAQRIEAELKWQETDCTLHLVLEGSCQDLVEIALCCVGADLSQSKISAGQSGDYPIALKNADGRPIYIYAEIVGRFAGTVCESTQPI